MRSERGVDQLPWSRHMDEVADASPTLGCTPTRPVLPRQPRLEGLPRSLGILRRHPAQPVSDAVHVGVHTCEWRSSAYHVFG